jgi:hypothetical protein
MATPTHEKAVRSLPSIRVEEPLEIALMRLAQREERKLSDYIKRVLRQHVFGHAESLFQDSAFDEDSRA